MGGQHSKRSKGKIFRPISDDALEEVKKFYKLEKVPLGRGAFGQVLEGVSITDPNFKVAIKVIKKNNMKAKDIKELNNEVQILNSLDHPNIVKYYEMYEDKKNIYLVMEYCTGVNLYEKLTYGLHRYSEVQCWKFWKQLLLALHHCHSAGITHRDVKLDNIMLTEGNQVKLIDFGLSKNATQKELMQSTTGTPYYMAPEVFTDEKYTSAVDIWSLGVVMYILLVGYRPFSGDNLAQIKKKIISGDVEFYPRDWNQVSSDAKRLVKAMMTPDPKKRLTAEEALKQPWFGLITDIKLLATVKMEQMLKPDTVKRLEQFNQGTILKRWALELLIKMLSPEEVKAYQEEFKKFDKTKSGFVTLKDFVEKLKDSKTDMTNKEMKKVAKEIDFDRKSHVNYSDLISATLNVGDYLTEGRLKTIYSKFDPDGTGRITSESLVEALNNFSFKISLSKAEEIINRYDYSRNGYLSIQDFKGMMWEND